MNFMDFMNYELLYDPEKNGLPMKVACFMSGSGTNVERIIENQTNYKVVLVFTDNKNSNAESIAHDALHKVPYVCNDKRDFLQGREMDDELRKEFDWQNETLMVSYDIDLIALCGYMTRLAEPLLERYGPRIINVHPADLARQVDGKRLFTGMHPVRDTILAGEKVIYATTHIAREVVDYGEILMRSRPLRVELPNGINVEDLKKPENKKLLDQVENDNQDRLKQAGDWEIFPKTIQMIANGRYAIDRKGGVYVDGMLMPNGFRL